MRLRCGLSSLSQALLRVDAKRAEPWVAASLFWQLRDDSAKGLRYAEKALRLDPYSVDAMYNRAVHLTAVGQQDLEATKQYRKLLEMEYRIRNFEGTCCHAADGSPASRLAIHESSGSIESWCICSACCAQDFLVLSDAFRTAGVVHLHVREGANVPQAREAAGEALEIWPNSWKAHKLMGVLFSATQMAGRKKAQHHFKQALRLMGTGSGGRTVILLADSYLSEEPPQYDDAVSCLRMFLSECGRTGLSTAVYQGSVHLKLASTLSDMADPAKYDDALTHYHAALSCSTDTDSCANAARKGMNRLDKLMSGIEPDDDEVNHF